MQQQAGHGGIAIAYAKPAREAPKAYSTLSFRFMLVALDCCFLGLQPVLVHLSKNKGGTYSFEPSSVNLITELTKAALALIALVALGTGRPGVPMYRSPSSFLADARHNRLLIIPAFLYACNNNLRFVMQLFFKPTATKMLGNLKVFMIALLMRLVLNRHFTLVQWEALLLLVCGITVNQLSNCSSPSIDQVHWFTAALCAFAATTVPSAASVYNELALKKDMETSVLLQQFFLYFYGALFNLLCLLVSCWWKQRTMVQMFEGQSLVTFILIVNNAAQGILSSFFFKYADTMLKKYSSTIATIFTAVMSYVLFGHDLSVNFIVGVTIVLISMHQFFTFGDPKGAKDGSKGEATSSQKSIEIDREASPLLGDIEMRGSQRMSSSLHDPLVQLNGSAASRITQEQVKEL